MLEKMLFLEGVEFGTLELDTKLAPFGVIQTVYSDIEKSNKDGFIEEGGHNFWSPELYNLFQKLALNPDNLGSYRVISQKLDEEKTKYKLGLLEDRRGTYLGVEIVLANLRFIDPMTSGIRKIKDNYIIDGTPMSSAVRLRESCSFAEAMCLNFPPSPIFIGRPPIRDTTVFDLETNAILSVECISEKVEVDLIQEYFPVSVN